MESGETELYRTNWQVDLWCAWRRQTGKPPLKESDDGYYFVLTSDQFSEYDKFLQCHDFLFFVPGKVFIKESELLNYYAGTIETSLKVVDLYGTRFYALTTSQLNDIAEWIELQLQNMDKHS